MKRFWIALGILTLLVMGGVLSVYVKDNYIWLKEALGIESKPEFYTVKYEVAYGFIAENGSFITYDGVADITYVNEAGGTSQENKTSLTWS